MRTSKLLVVVIVLQLVVLAGQWLGTPSISPASAQITDPGRDRSQMIDELRAVNAKLDKLIDLLGSGDVQVRVSSSDEGKGKAAGR